MKTRKYLRITLLLALVLCLGCVVALTSCGEKLSDIYVANSDTPRLNYVLGQDLDLSSGVLTVIGSEGERKIPLTSEEVTVSGYNKNQLGDQTLTVSYGELSTTITVTVIPRAVAENFENKYFIGDEFNGEMGKIKIATDDAITFTVNMSDDKVELVSFDSSAAGTATVTVRYTDSIGSYYCQFDVTVYEPANIEFTPPEKTTYFSHDSAVPEVAGGFFTVVSADGKLTKYVPLTASMISGFDPSAATIANRNEPLSQKLEVTYLTKKANYDVDIIFSAISVVESYTHTDAENPENNGILAGIDWSLNSDLSKVMTEEEAAAALDAIKTYYTLKDNERALISDSAKTILARAGSVAAQIEFLKEFKKLENTLLLENDAEKGLMLYLPCKSFEQARTDSAILSDADAEVNKLAGLLRSIEADFAATVISGETTVESYVYVYSADVQNNMTTLLAHLVAAYTPLADIPEDWTVDDLTEYGDGIITAALLINSAEYYEKGYANYYTGIISPWRGDKNDFFEIIYSYFLYKYEGGREFMAQHLFGEMPMPGKLESWYQSLSNAVKYENFYLNYYNSDALLSDVTVFMFYYYNTLDLAEEIKKSDNQLWKDTYAAYDIDYMNRVYLYTYSTGFLYHARGQVDSENYHKLWEAYYEVLKPFNVGKLSVETNKTELVAMVNAFQELSPSELYGFLSSLNLMYSSTKGVISTLSYTDKVVYNIFTRILRDYYSTYLTDASKPLMATLLSAMENYALVGYKETALADFETAMAKLIEDYNSNNLTDADRESFNTYFGTSYTKYLKIYNLIKGTETLTLTPEETAALDALKASVDRFYVIYSDIAGIVNAGNTPPTALYGVLYSLYAEVEEAYAAFMKIASADALTVFAQRTYDVLGGTHTLEKAYYSVDTSATSILSQLSAQVYVDGVVETVTGWELLKEFGADGVLTDMATLLYSVYYPEGITLTADYINALMASVRALTPFQQSILTFFGTDSTYYSALKSYYTATLTEGGAEMAGKLLDAEAAYRAYAIDTENAEKEAAFTAIMAEIKAAYSAIADADKTQLDAIYTHYIALYEAIIAAPEEAPAA